MFRGCQWDFFDTVPAEKASWVRQSSDRSNYNAFLLVGGSSMAILLNAYTQEWPTLRICIMPSVFTELLQSNLQCLLCVSTRLISMCIFIDINTFRLYLHCGSIPLLFFNRWAVVNIALLQTLPGSYVRRSPTCHNPQAPCHHISTMFGIKDSKVCMQSHFCDFRIKRP